MEAIIVRIGNSQFQVDSSNQVFRFSKGRKTSIHSGKSVDQAIRLAENLRAIRLRKRVAQKERSDYLSDGSPNG